MSRQEFLQLNSEFRGPGILFCDFKMHVPFRAKRRSLAALSGENASLRHLNLESQYLGISPLSAMIALKC
jgi:hypothetical protein